MPFDLFMRSLHLENFRGFQNLFLDFHPRLNVFLGDNGAGKSSILDALSLALGEILLRAGVPGAIKTHIDYNDIHNGAWKCTIRATMYATFTFALEIAAVNLRDSPERKTDLVSKLYHAEDFIQYLKNGFHSPLGTIYPPVFIRYHAERHSRASINFDVSLADSSPKACYYNALSTSLGFDDFFNWFKNKEDVENETKVREKNLDHVDTQLQVVRDAMHTCLGFTSFFVDRKVRMLALKKNDVDFFYNQLSDGEKGYLLLVADIARRLAIANPHSDDPLATGRGIVIIDEIELHLHPKWQRTIIPKLLETFKNCQFIITTHSPQVVGEVMPESIWILEEGEQPYHPSRSYGMESSELLQEVMGAPSVNQGVTKDLLRIERLIDDENYAQAREALRELAGKTGKIPSIIGLNSLFTMYGEEQADLPDTQATQDV